MKPEDLKKLARKLGECICVCNDCFTCCLDEPDVARMAGCIRCNKDCIDVCSAALALVYNKGRCAEEILEMCARMCEMCAEECSKFPHDHCKECAAVCRQCAKECNDCLKAMKK